MGLIRMHPIASSPLERGKQYTRLSNQPYGRRLVSPSGAAPQATCQASGSLTEVSVRLVGKLLRYSQLAHPVAA